MEELPSTPSHEQAEIGRVKSRETKHISTSQMTYKNTCLDMIYVHKIEKKIIKNVLHVTMS